MDLLCIGNAMVDVFAEFAPDSSLETVPGAELLTYHNFRKHFGLNDPVQHISPESAAAIVAALRKMFREYPANGPDTMIKSGGNAANTAKMAARLGLTVAFAGAVGGAGNASETNAADSATALDHYGAIFEEELKRAGVATYLARKQSPTGLFISITQRAGDTKHDERQDINLRRVIAASPSAALELNQNDIDESLFAQTRILVLEGFLLGNKNLAGSFLAMAEKYSLTIALDAGTADAAVEHAALIHSWFGRFSLILFLNEKEAEAFTEALGFGSNWENFFTEASKHSSGLPRQSVLVAVKLAERGAAVFSDGTIYRVETTPVDTADTTGAGDDFAAGFLAAWLRGEDPRQCGQAGNAAAAQVLRGI